VPTIWSFPRIGFFGRAVFRWPTDFLLALFLAAVFVLMTAFFEAAFVAGSLLARLLVRAVFLLTCLVFFLVAIRGVYHQL